MAKKASKAKANLQDWVAKTLMRRGRWRLAGAVACALLAVPATLFTWLVIRVATGIVLRPFVPRETLGLVALGVMAVFVALYFVANWRSFTERFSFDSREEMAVMRAFSMIAGGGMFRMAGPRSMFAMAKILILFMMAAPALVHLAWQLFRQAQVASAARVGPLSKVLDRLYTQGGRVPIEEVVALAAPSAPQDVLRQLELFEGVIFLTGAPPGFTLTDAFQEELGLAMAKGAAAP